VFFEFFLKPLFDIVDYWWRYEWQAHGSSHGHGFAWFRNTPKVEHLDLTKQEDIRKFIQYWDFVISTMNPGKACSPADIHPSAQLFSTLEDTKKELAECLNRFQRHIKSK
jgi:hypothetical protein